MNLEEYQNEIIRTAEQLLDSKDKYEVVSFGIIGELGEVVDHLKKVFFHGHRLDELKLVEEIGDLLWYTCLGLYFQDKHELKFENDTYISKRRCIKSRVLEFAERISRECFYHGYEEIYNDIIELLPYVLIGVTIDDIMKCNIAKLERRYPNGFTTKDSIERED